MQNEFDPPALVRKSKRPPKECASVANAAVDRGEKSFVEAGLALIEALDQVDHGKKKDWLKTNFNKSIDTAYRLMRAAKSCTDATYENVVGGFSEPISIPDDSTPQQVATNGKQLCRFCDHKRQVGKPLPDKCEDCKELRSATKPPEPAKTEPSTPPKPPRPYIPPDASDAWEPCDDASPPLPNEVRPEHPELPKSTQNALADTWHLDCAAKMASIRKQARGVISWSVWLDLESLDHLLQDAEQCFLSAAPRAVCPDCGGMKAIDKVACSTCRGGGFLAAQAGVA